MKSKIRRLANKYWPALLVLVIVLVGVGVYLSSAKLEEEVVVTKSTKPSIGFSQLEEPEPTLKSIEVAQPGSYGVLDLPVHYFQTFNNCGPATLAMGMAYFGVNKTQHELGMELRPYQNVKGDNDDKSVTFEEMAVEAEKFGFRAYHRPGGNVEMLKVMVANGIPVMTRTWTRFDEDIGHYRVVKGYDEIRGTVIQDDSLQGKDISYSYGEFEGLWEKFGFEYLVIVPEGKIGVVETILGEDVDGQVAWRKAVDFERSRLAIDPSDNYSRFNLAVAYYHVGEFEMAVKEFEGVEGRLAFRTLWYQIEPLLAYRKLGRDDELLLKIERVLIGGNRAFAELYQIRGEIYLDRGEISKARREFEQAIKYNENFEPAKIALESIN